MAQNRDRLDVVIEDSREDRATGMGMSASLIDNNHAQNFDQENEALLMKKHESVAVGNVVKGNHVSGSVLRGGPTSVYSEAMTNKELEIVRAEMAKNEFTFGRKDKIVSWTVLITLLLAQISNQWQRFMISTAYNYTMPDGEADDGYYMMSVDIPDFTASKYGLVSGVLFTSLFSVVVLFSGVASDNCSRRLLLAFAAMLWSVTSLTTAIS